MPSKAIYDKLIEDQSSGSFYDDLGGRVYTKRGKRNDDRPMCVIDVLRNDPDETFTSTDLDGDVQIAIYGEESVGLAALAGYEAKAYDLLHNQPVTLAGYTNVEARCVSRALPNDDPENETLGLVSVYQLQGTQAA